MISIGGFSTPLRLSSCLQGSLSFWTSEPSSPQSQLAATKQYCRFQHLFYPSYNPSYNPPFSRKRRKPFRRGLPYRGAMIPRRDPLGRSPGDLQVSSKGPPRIFPPPPLPVDRKEKERERERERNPKDIFLG
jgi:hypothetical protein